MPLCWSSCHLSRGCCVGGAAEIAENLAGDVAFEAADNRGLALPLGRATAQVIQGWLMAAHAGYDHAVKGGVGLAVAAVVEPVPVCLAAGCRAGATPAPSS